MGDVVIVAAKRSPIGNFLGSLSNIPATELGAYVIRSLLDETGVKPNQISEVIIGQVITAGSGQNPARQSAFKAGLPKEVSAFTINQVCGSGLKAVNLGVQAILCGDAEIIIAGGQENMSLAPYLLRGCRRGLRMGNAPLVDSMVYDGLTDVYNQYHMGVTAENIAMKYGVTREDQDLFAFRSQEKSKLAQSLSKFNDEIVPITVFNKKGEASIFAYDEFMKPNTTFEVLNKLKPSFKKENGTVTPGNSSGANDGAALVMWMREGMAKQLNLKPLASIRNFASIGLEPELMGLGPIYATKQVLSKISWSTNNLDLVEINEAFAAQAIVVNQELCFDPNIVNVNGGAIALGHPIGASGCRILVSLLHEMQRRDAKKGLATLCVGGGIGVALAVERK